MSEGTRNFSEEKQEVSQADRDLVSGRVKAWEGVLQENKKELTEKTALLESARLAGKKTLILEKEIKRLKEGMEQLRADQFRVARSFAGGLHEGKIFLNEILKQDNENK